MPSRFRHCLTTACLMIASQAHAQGPAPAPAPALPSGATMTLEVPAQQSWAPGRRIQLNVTTKLADAPKLKVAVGPFVDASTGKALQSSFCLAQTIKDKCQTGDLAIPANAIQQLWLEGTGSPDAGTYAGTIKLAAANGLQASQPLTINVTSSEWQMWGLAALIVGVALSFVMTVWLPHQRARDLAMRPFVLLGQRLQTARRRLKVEDTNTLEQAQNLADQIEPTALQSGGIIPPVWPGSTADPANADSVKAYLERSEARLAAIELLASSLNRAPDSVVRGRIDALAGASNFPQPTLQSDIDALLAGIQQQPPEAAALPTPAALVFREEIRNFTFWLVSSILAVALGYVLLIEGDPAFGGWKDVATALLWGLGVATAGTKVADLTVGQVRAAIQPAG